MRAPCGLCAASQQQGQASAHELQLPVTPMLLVAASPSGCSLLDIRDLIFHWLEHCSARHRCRMTALMCHSIFCSHSTEGNKCMGWKARGFLKFRGRDVTPLPLVYQRSRISHNPADVPSPFHLTRERIHPLSPLSLGIQPQADLGEFRIRHDGIQIQTTEELIVLMPNPIFSDQTRHTELHSSWDSTRNGDKHYETKFIKTFYKSDFIIQVSTDIYICTNWT